MSIRETARLETPAEKHQVEYKTYTTGRDKRAIEMAVLAATEIDFTKDEEGKLHGDVKNIKADIMQVGVDAALKQMVVKVNGHAEGELVDGKPFSIIDALLDMLSEDYDFVVAKINAATGGDQSFLGVTKASNTPIDSSPKE